ncbi:hypothetical protein F8M41_005009 [Gigaspora margarita]|uniref:Uncharacterized protein n=1 Tax=Gigaspora margarita TaxID=4874 RepID=A0A8H4A770_GIGMA|nr:hypothetical protein F8M41_005009 [Gigaspora margarita]
MLSNISELGPGFDYFLNTHCQDWDALQYHEAWKDNLNKEDVTRTFCKQIHKIKKNGIEEERQNARRLKNQFKLASTSGTGNIVQGRKQPYKIHEQSGIEEPPSYRLRKRNCPINYTKNSSKEETDSEYEKSKRVSNTCTISVAMKLND